MSEEKNSSEVSNDDFIVTSDQLPELLKTKILGDIVQVSDKGYQRMILLDDSDGNKRWTPWNGNDKEFAIKSNEWYKKGQQLFKEAAMLPEETAEFREVLLAIGVLGNFMKWSEEDVGELIDRAVVLQAHKIYCRLKKIDVPVDTLHNDDEFLGYINLTAIMAKTFLDLVESVKESAKQASEDNSTGNNPVLN